MSPPTKDTSPSIFSKWLPALVAFVGFIGNAVYIGRWSGALDARLVAVESHAASTALHMPFERKIELFVTRTEYSAKQLSRDTELAEIKAAFRGIDAKLDRLIERSSKNGTE